MTTISKIDPIGVARLEVASDWLVRIHGKSLTESEVKEWIQWCETDPANLAAFEQMESVWDGLGRVEKPIAQPKFAARLKFLRWVGALSSARPSMARWPMVAAAVALMVVTAVFVRSTYTPAAPVIATGLETPVGKNEDAKLPDGSSLALGAKSAISIAFEPALRSVKMKDGQAFFKVAPDKARPFVVDTGRVLVKAVGTAFDIRKNGDRVVVSVTEGVVEVSREGTAGPLTRVAAGYQYTWAGEGQDVKLAQVEADSVTGWRAGRLEYLGEPLGTVVSNVNRYSARPIVIDDPALADIQYTGTVFVGSIGDWVGALQSAFPIVSESRADGSILLKRRFRSPS